MFCFLSLSLSHWVCVGVCVWERTKARARISKGKNKGQKNLVYVLTPGCIGTLIMIGFNLFFQKRSDKENISKEKSKTGGVKCIHPVFTDSAKKRKGYPTWSCFENVVVVRAEGELSSGRRNTCWLHLQTSKHSKLVLYFCIDHCVDKIRLQSMLKF